MRKLRQIWLLLLAFTLSLPGSAQLSLVIEDVPAFTPPTDTLYLAGSFNDWKPGHPAYAFDRLANNRFFFQFEGPVSDFSYKITRGDWASVESDAAGNATAERRYTGQGEKGEIIYLSIAGWEDLRDSIPYEMLTLRVVKVPDNTPIDASLFVAGSFNGWTTEDPDYRLKLQADGSYSVQIPIRSDTTEYKFTRGNWDSVEGRPNGLSRVNRRYIRGVDQPVDVQELTIATWEDLAGHRLSLYSLIILLAVLQSLLLIISINTFKNSNRRANLFLSILIVVISITGLARTAAFKGDVFKECPKLFLFPDIIYFLFGPLLFLYIRSLLALPKKSYWARVGHFVPALLLVVAYWPLIIQDNDVFRLNVVNLVYKPYFNLAAALGAIFSAYYWIRSYGLIQRFQADAERNYSFDPNLQFLRTVMYIIGSALALWLSIYAVGGLAWLLEQDWSLITETMVDTVWIIVALVVYAMGYYVMREPQIFQQIEMENDAVLSGNKEAAPTEKEPLTADELQAVERLRLLMQEKKPYLNPKLSLAELADMSDLPPHQLSKLINDGFERNFFDFVNSYRVEAFQERIEKGEHKQHTFLTIALEVGFNSKTAFNRAFKKLTQQTPREYLRNQSLK